MSDNRGFGIDMAPERIPCWARVDDAPPQPSTESERHEHVNADILRRACQVRIQDLIEHVRRLPAESPINVPNLVRVAAQDLEDAIHRYLAVERKFRRHRNNP